MTTDRWDDRHQHNFQALFCLKPETDITALADISQAAVAYVNAASPKVFRCAQTRAIAISVCPVRPLLNVSILCI